MYSDYGKKNLSTGSRINLKNSYSKSHYDSEKIIKTKFLNHKNMFTILRVGNVFGFKKKNKRLGVSMNNLIHSLCILALKKKKILIKNGSIQRTFIPSQIFVQTINLIIKKKFIKNSVINISYKSFNLKNIAQLIAKRFNFLFNLNLDIQIKNFIKKNIFLIYCNQNLKVSYNKNIFFFEIDRILKNLKK